MACKDCIKNDVCVDAYKISVEYPNYCGHFIDVNKTVILPCKIGDTVYCIATPCGGCEDFDVENNCKNCAKAEIITCNFDYDIIGEFNKTVFLTRDETQKALEENNA